MRIVTNASTGMSVGTLSLDEQIFRRVCREVRLDSLSIVAEAEERRSGTDLESLLLQAILTNLRSRLRLNQIAGDDEQPRLASRADFYRKEIDEIVETHAQSPFDHDALVVECLRHSREIIDAVSTGQEREIAEPCGMYSSVYVA